MTYRCMAAEKGKPWLGLPLKRAYPLLSCLICLSLDSQLLGYAGIHVGWRTNIQSGIGWIIRSRSTISHLL